MSDPTLRIDQTTNTDKVYRWQRVADAMVRTALDQGNAPVIVVGAPVGAGKTHLAQQLAEAIESTVVVNPSWTAAAVLSVPPTCRLFILDGIEANDWGIFKAAAKAEPQRPVLCLVLEEAVATVRVFANRTGRSLRVLRWAQEGKQAVEIRDNPGRETK